MGLPSASGASFVITTNDGLSLKCAVLTMRQLGEVGHIQHNAVIGRMIARMEAMPGMTPGQTLIALREFEVQEPTFHEIMHWGQTPEGSRVVLMLAIKTHNEEFDEKELESLGTPLDRIEYASKALQLRPVEDDIPDPSKEEGDTTGEKTPPS